MEANTSGQEHASSLVRLFPLQSDEFDRRYQELEVKVSALTRKLNTEQAARFNQLRETAALSHRLSQLLESLPGGILVLDAAGVVIQHNSEAGQLLRCQLNGTTWDAVLERTVTRDTRSDGHLKLRDGRWLSLARRALPEDDCEILLIADVTENRKLAEQRERAERLSAIGEMTAEFAHQVRTPLASAMLYAAQLDTARPDQQRVVAQISERLCDLGRMVDDMLLFASGPKPQTDAVNVGQLIAKAVATVDNQLKTDTDLSVLVRSDELHVQGNTDALCGALVNLIKNSEQACSADAKILVDARLEDGQVCISISDNGCGIPVELEEHVFDAFFTTRAHGTGLGLAVVKSVCIAHDGDVQIDSSKFGTTISLRFPAYPGANDA